MNVNQWIGIGHVTRDPETKAVGNSKVSSFRLAVNRSFKKGDEWVERPMFIDVEAWSHNAEKAERSIQRGTEVFVRGRLECDEWTSKEGGERRSKHKIYALELQIGKKRKDGKDADISSEAKAMAGGGNTGNNSEGFSDSDVPF